MDKFLSLKYYLTPIPNPDFQFTKLALFAGAILIIAGFAVGIYRKKYTKDAILKKIIKRYPGKLKIYGLLFLILLLIREAGIPYISMRIWWILLIFLFLYSFIKSAITFKSEYKKRHKQSIKKNKKKRYLPGKR